MSIPRSQNRRPTKAKATALGPPVSGIAKFLREGRMQGPANRAARAFDGLVHVFAQIKRARNK
jgi:hypothetical protein